MNWSFYYCLNRIKAYVVLYLKGFLYLEAACSSCISGARSLELELLLLPLSIEASTNLCLSLTQRIKPRHREINNYLSSSF